MTIKSLMTAVLLVFSNAWLSAGDGGYAKVLTEAYPNAEIKIMQRQNKFNVDVAKGTKLVFYIDDVSLGKVYFQIPSDRRFFRYTDESMRKVDLMIVKDQKLLAPDSGEINGFKLADNIWKVDLTLKIGGKDYTISHRFHVEDQLSAVSK